MMWNSLRKGSCARLRVAPGWWVVAGVLLALQGPGRALAEEACTEGRASSNVLTMAEQADLVVIASRSASSRSDVSVQKVLKAPDVAELEPERAAERLRAVRSGRISFEDSPCDPFFEGRGRYLVFLRYDANLGRYVGVAHHDSAIPLAGTRRFPARPQVFVAPGSLLHFVRRWLRSTDEDSRGTLVTEALRRGKGLIQVDAMQYAFGWLAGEAKSALSSARCEALDQALDTSVAKRELDAGKADEWRARIHARCGEETAATARAPEESKAVASSPVLTSPAASSRRARGGAE